MEDGVSEVENIVPLLNEYNLSDVVMLGGGWEEGPGTG